MAIKKTEGSVSFLEKEKAEEAKKQEELKEEAIKNKEKLDTIVLEFKAKAQAKVSAQPKNLLQLLWSKILWFIHKRRELQKRYRKAIIWGNVGLMALVLVGMVIGMHVFAPDTSKYETRSPVLFDTQGNVLYSAMTEGDYHRIHTSIHDVDPLYLKIAIRNEYIAAMDWEDRPAADPVNDIYLKAAISYLDSL